MSQIQHGDFTGVAEVDRSSNVGQHELVEAGDQVAVMADAARLLAVAIDRQIAALEGLDDEIGHGPAIVLAHALAIGIEYTRNAHVRAVHAVVRHSHGLGKALGLVVHAADANGVDVAEVLLGLGMYQGVAIDFRRGGQQELGLLGHRQPQGLVCAQRADLEDVDAQPLKVGRASWAGEVQNEVERAIYVDVVGNVVLNKLESRVAEQVGDVFGPAREEVVHADDFAAFFQQQVAEMRPQETRAAGDQHAHRVGSFFDKLRYLSLLVVRHFAARFSDIKMYCRLRELSTSARGRWKVNAF